MAIPIQRRCGLQLLRAAEYEMLRNILTIEPQAGGEITLLQMKETTSITKTAVHCVASVLSELGFLHSDHGELTRFKNRARILVPDREMIQRVVDLLNAIEGYGTTAGLRSHVYLARHLRENGSCAHVSELKDFKGAIDAVRRARSDFVTVCEISSGFAHETVVGTKVSRTWYTITSIINAKITRA